MKSKKIDIIHYQRVMELLKIYEEQDFSQFGSYLGTFTSDQLESFLESIDLSKEFKIDPYYLIDLSCIQTRIQSILTDRWVRSRQGMSEN